MVLPGTGGRVQKPGFRTHVLVGRGCSHPEGGFLKAQHSKQHPENRLWDNQDLPDGCWGATKASHSPRLEGGEDQSPLLVWAPSQPTEVEDLHVTCLVLPELWSLRGFPVYIEWGPVR